ncbi:type II toxin-antitoxin system RelB/DinJ family antitoxin [Alloscardovia omnicolens]|uniref:type II toxin-antitoxin system RelB/DinJ family antitoxin n=1 Tax=Alloscardovia omnicolens TaxID=419015 RepID=UPI001EF9E536|nr:type II toxin-antitoxin system RelB/DinJ family antitoxin [Alloscardovia omnicolens]MDK6251856.1 type II toxin-antitoxin system RelB/DinJ family antitoxin [Alloscardovia omnicolens]MDK6521984.1 type II toxin-antitoxin system RelB/DinJ family antitoxin [Alloscardovia omnicolens]
MTVVNSRKIECHCVLLFWFFLLVLSVLARVQEIIRNTKVSFCIQNVYNRYYLQGSYYGKDIKYQRSHGTSNKKQAEELFGSFGISVTDAINIFIHTSLLEGGFPFAIKQPRYNKETEAAMVEARRIMSGEIPAKRYTSIEDLLSDIENEDD